MSNQVVLEEEFDENYEPTEEEILDYAKFLGINPDTEKHLLWIAQQSLKAPLPPNWKPCQTDDGNIYYFNFTTGESIWDHPCDEHFRKLYAEEKAKGPNSTGPPPKSQIVSAKAATKLGDLPAPKPVAKLGALPTIIPSTAAKKPGAPVASPLSKSIIPQLDSENDGSSKEGGDDDWDALTGDEDDDKIIDSVLKGKDLSKDLQAPAPEPQRQSSGRELTRIAENDDFELSSASSENLAPRPRRGSTGSRQQARDSSSRAPSEERLGVGAAARQTRERWEAEIEATEKAERAKAAVEIEHIEEKYRQSVQDAELKAKTQTADEIDRVRAASRRTIEQAEREEKHAVEIALSEIKRKSAEQLASARRDESADADRNIQRLKERHRQELQRIEDDLRREHEQRKTTEQAQHEREMRQLKEQTADALTAGRQREAARQEQELREMQVAFADKRAAVERDHRAQLEGAEREFRRQLDHTADDSAVAAATHRTEEEHAKHLAKLVDSLQQVEKDTCASLERDSATRIQYLKDEIRSREKACNSEQEAKLRSVQADWDVRIKDLEIRMRKREDEIRAKLNKGDGGSREAETLQRENEQRLATQRDRKAELEKVERELAEVEAKLRTRRADLDAQRRDTDLAAADIAASAPARRTNKHGKPASALRDRSRSRSRHQHDVLFEDHDGKNDSRNEAPQDSGEVPRSMLRGLAADVLGAARSSPEHHAGSHAELPEEGEESLKFLYTEGESEGSDVESTEYKNDYRRSASPSTLLATRLRSEEQQIQQAKQFLRRQQKNIGVRQRELGVAQERWKQEIEEISMHLQRGGIPVHTKPLDPGTSYRGSIGDSGHSGHHQRQLQRTDTLDEIEGELGKLLGALKGSIYSSRTDETRGRARSPRRAASPASYRHRTASAYTAPRMHRSGGLTHTADPATTAVSQHRKRAWEVGHTRTESLLAEHNAWLKGVYAFQGLLQRNLVRD
ncbi:hypothetical protein HKX48_004423 [Thoreauomyces humboldtii]|nr:hypothetical protein HKX48_004423 [Thoreauomyces humboldtii]